MPLFRCEKCNCVENTALGFYWSRKVDWPKEYHGKLCSACGPSHYPDGTSTGLGTWHGKFPQKSANGMLMDQNGDLWSQGQVDAGLFPSHYSLSGRVVIDENGVYTKEDV